MGLNELRVHKTANRKGWEEWGEKGRGLCFWPSPCLDPFTNYCLSKIVLNPAVFWGHLKISQYLPKEEKDNISSLKSPQNLSGCLKHLSLPQLGEEDKPFCFLPALPILSEPTGIFWKGSPHVISSFFLYPPFPFPLGRRAQWKKHTHWWRSDKRSWFKTLLVHQAILSYPCLCSFQAGVCLHCWPLDPQHSAWCSVTNCLEYDD